MSDLRLTVLGCAGSFPGPGTACSGYLVQGGGVNVVVDLGPGSLANLQEHLALDRIDAVVLSHGHPDHWIDLTGLEVAWTYALRRQGLPVYGTAHNHALATGLMGELGPTIDWHEVHDGGHVRIGDLRLDLSATDHYVDTLAVRISSPGGRVVVYSADTGPGWSLSELAPASGAIDLALCEATNLADGEGEGVLHLSARQAGAMARKAQADRLVLTHLQPGTDSEASRLEGADAFGRPVLMAREHAVYDI